MVIVVMQHDAGCGSCYELLKRVLALGMQSTTCAGLERNRGSLLMKGAFPQAISHPRPRVDCHKGIAIVARHIVDIGDCALNLPSRYPSWRTAAPSRTASAPGSGSPDAVAPGCRRQATHPGPSAAPPRSREALAELHPKELLQHRAVKPFHEAVRLRAPDLGPAVLDVVELQVDLIRMARHTAELRPVVGEHGLDLQPVGLVEGQHVVAPPPPPAAWRCAETQRRSCRRCPPPRADTPCPPPSGAPCRRCPGTAAPRAGATPRAAPESTDCAAR